MAKGKSPDLSVVLITYVPFLSAEAGEQIPAERMKELGSLLDNMPSGQAEACLWFKRDVKSETEYSISPVFLYNAADDLVKHMLLWCENKPMEWFDLHLRQKHNKYVFALIPKCSKSVERYGIAYQLRTGYPLPKDTRFTLMFRSLHFVSGASNVFNVERTRLPDPLEIGFLDATKVDMKDIEGSLQKLDESEIRWVGPFSLSPNKNMLQYLDGILDGAREPTRASFKS